MKKDNSHSKSASENKNRIVHGKNEIRSDQVILFDQNEDSENF